MTSNRIIKVIAILCFALFAFILLVLRNNPATGFESSIYTGTPSIVWGVLVFSIVCGTVIILHQLYYRKEQASNLWVIGLVLIVFSLVIVLIAAHLRGYLSGNLDAIGITAVVKNIIATGNFESTNFYPIFYVFLAALSQVTTIATLKLVGFMPAFFSVLFILCIYLFAGSVLRYKGQVILATFAGALLLAITAHGQTSLAPHGVALLFSTLLFFLCVKFVSPTVPKVSYFVLVFILVLMFPMFHIVSSFAVVLIMLSILLTMMLQNVRAGNPVPANLINYRIIIVFSILLVLWGNLWFTQFDIWEAGVIRLFGTFQGIGISHFAQIEFGIIEAGKYGYSVWAILLKRYNVYLLFAMFSLASLIITLVKTRDTKNIPVLLLLYGSPIILLLATIMFFGFRLPFAPERLIQYALIICTLFFGHAFYAVLVRTTKARHRGYYKFGGLLITIILLSTLVNGVFTRYPSPYILLSSGQISSRELKGMEWFINKKDTSFASVYYFTGPFKYEHLLLTREERVNRIELPSEITFSQPPWHFNYDKRNMLGESYSRHAYLILNEKGEKRFTDVFPEIADIRFNTADFDRLEDDASLDRLYTSRGFEVWYIHPLAPFNPTTEMER